MAIVRAITDQQRGLGLGRSLVSLARVRLLGFRGKRRGESGSILFDIQTRELQRSMYNLYMRGQAAYSTKAKLWMSKYY